MADEITLEQDVDEILGMSGPAETGIPEDETLGSSVGEPEDEEEPGPGGAGEDEDDED